MGIGEEIGRITKSPSGSHCSRGKVNSKMLSPLGVDALGRGRFACTWLKGTASWCGGEQKVFFFPKR